MLEKRQAPANLHFQSLNPHIDMEDSLQQHFREGASNGSMIPQVLC